MARSCTACTHAQSRQLDAELFGGAPIGDLAQQYRLSDSALRRHRARHLSATVLRELRVTETTGTTDLLARLVEILDDTRRVRSAALLANQGDLVLRAAAQARTTIEFLVSRLGIDDTEVVRELELGEAVAVALGQATRQVPALGRVVADRLRENGHTEAADDLDRHAETSALALERTAT